MIPATCVPWPSAVSSVGGTVGLRMLAPAGMSSRPARSGWVASAPVSRAATVTLELPTVRLQAAGACTTGSPHCCG